MCLTGTACTLYMVLVFDGMHHFGNLRVLKDHNIELWFLGCHLAGSAINELTPSSLVRRSPDFRQKIRGSGRIPFETFQKEE